MRRQRSSVLAFALVGLAAALASVRTQTASPLALVILVDVSASVDFRQLELPNDKSEDIENAVLPRLGPGDRLAVGAFGDTLAFSGWLPGDAKRRSAAIRALFKDRSVGLNGPSRIWDAVGEAVGLLEKESPGPDRRRAIVLLSDGKASGNRVGLEALIAHARSASVAVSVIASAAPEPRVPLSDLQPHHALQRLSSETGGRYAEDAVGDTFRQRHPGPLLRKIVEGLR